MILSIGADACYHHRFSAEAYNIVRIARTFNEVERHEAAKSLHIAQYYSGHLAAKAAIMKALQRLTSQQASYLDIQVLEGIEHIPEITFLNHLKHRLSGDITAQVSISHESDISIAWALIEFSPQADHSNYFCEQRFCNA